ncbi:T-cell surface antigen CD2 isoform X2 [Dendropsophus ebraccatus]|uniref:T-cell surface antigen CD2 isoform X2 n=1 Tax=Dendropsophus ebraccatus TaxID=150705 RepID=UPI003831F522
METPGSVLLFSWTGLFCSLLLSGTIGVRSEEFYTAPNQTVLLRVPTCAVQPSDTIVWERHDKENVRLARWKEKPSYYSDCDQGLCVLYQNGSLSLQQPEGKKHYTMTVHTSRGDHKCNQTTTLIVEDLLEAPILKHSCSSKGASLTCSSSGSSISLLSLSWSRGSKNTSERSIQSNINLAKADVTCTVRNRVSDSTSTMTVNCAGWDIYLIASVAGGAVFLIIFIALVICTVKYKPWRSHSHPDVEMNDIQHHRLPQLPGPTSPAYMSGTTQDDLTEQGSPLQDTREPGGRKGKQNRGRRPAPQAPGEMVVSYTSTSQRNVPALPGNHPNEQAPRPQPRTVSKPQRKKRRKECQ